MNYEIMKVTLRNRKGGVSDMPNCAEASWEKESPRGGGDLSGDQVGISNCEAQWGRLVR